MTDAVRSGSAPAQSAGGATALLAAIREDRLLYLVIAVYVLAASLVWWPHRADVDGAFLSYFWWWVELAAGFYCIYVPLVASWRIVRTRPAKPLRAFLAAAVALSTPRLFAALILYCVMAFGLGAFTTLKPMLPLLQPFHFDVALADLDAILHGGEPWTRLQDLLGRPGVTRVIDHLYVPVWGTMATYSPLFVSVLCRDRVLRLQYLLAIMIGLMIYGTLLAALFMSGGPAFYGLLTGDAERFQAMREYLSRFAGEPFAAHDLQDMLWRAYVRGREGFGVGISAFPSVHVTFACLFACLAWRAHRVAGVLAWMFAAVIMVGSVHLGWHYAVESWFILLTLWPVWALCGAAARRSVNDNPEGQAQTSSP